MNKIDLFVDKIADSVIKHFFNPVSKYVWRPMKNTMLKIVKMIERFFK